MPGVTKIIGHNFNDFSWPVNQDGAAKFEILIGKYLKNNVATKDGKIKVYATDQVKDYGKDFIIHAKHPFKLFGSIIQKKVGNEISTIYVEVKTTSQERLTDAFLVDIPQNFESKVDYYVLVTNATITPYYQYLAQENWKNKNVQFILIDRFLLYRSLEKTNIKNEFYASKLVPVGSNHIANKADQISIEYQVEHKFFKNNRKVDIYFSIRNYSNQSKMVSLNLASDLSWKISYKEFEKIISPYGLICLRIECERILFDGPGDLRLQIESQFNHETIIVQEKELKFIFDPPFVGTKHKKIKSSIQKLLIENDGLSIINVIGEAGIGKSRIIEELAKTLQDTKYNYRQFYFSTENKISDFLDFLTLVDYKTPQSDNIQSCLRDFLFNFNPVASDWIICFEDLHHCSKDIINIFKDFLINQPKKNTSIVFLLTGRNDFTFPNEEYFSLLQLSEILKNDKITNFEVFPFESSESELLIQEIIYNIPKSGIDKIAKLCQNNPFIIVELIQYLLDLDLAQLLSRRYIGILDVEKFSSDNSFPSSIEEIHFKRLESLRKTSRGQLSLQFLVIASFFGYEIQEEIFNLFLDGREYEEVWINLQERRFIKYNNETSRVSFTHENLLYFVRKYSQSSGRREKYAKLLISNTRLFNLLSNFEKANLYYFIGENRRAFNLFKPIWDRIQNVTNFSSEEIDKNYFNYLDNLFECAIKINIDSEEIVKVILAKAYMGIHNFPLYVGQESCVKSEKMLAILYGSNSEKSYYSLAINQLQAHGLQNMGKTTEALQLMLEIESKVRNRKLDYPHLEFDLNDRFSEFYRKMNHLELSKNYGKLAKYSVKKTNDEKLLACHLITDAGLKLYNGKITAMNAAEKAYQQSKKIQVTRFEIYTQLTILIIKSIYDHDNLDLLKDIYYETKDLLLYSAKNNLSDSIMRAQLFLATLGLQCFEEKEIRYKIATEYINAGQSNSIRYGNGLFDWAFDNLAAVVNIHEKSDLDIIRSRFQTCHERLRRRGLLFLGARDGIYPNYLAISNIVRFFGEFSEDLGMKYIYTLEAYDNEFLFKEKNKRQILEKALKGNPIFTSTRRHKTSFKYPYQNGYYTPIF